MTEHAVLNDTSGLHLGAGPYFLLYSRVMSRESERLASLPWPGEIKVCLGSHCAPIVFIVFSTG